MQRHLETPLARRREGGIDRSWCGAPVLVHLVSRGPGERLFRQRCPRDGVALAQQQDVDRYGVQSPVHVGQVPRSRRDRGGLRAFRGTGAPAHHRCDAGRQRLVQLRRRQKVDVGVDPSGGEDLALTSYDVR